MDLLTQRQLDLEIATEAAFAAGAVLRAKADNLDSIEDKGPAGDLVTDADKAAERLVLDLLQRHRPDYAILAEESGRLGNPDSELLWAIDPLDGTTNYAHQLPIASVSIALLRGDEPQLGVIYDPFRDELFRAAIGLGATKNRQPIGVSATDDLSRSLLASGFAYDRRDTLDNNYAEFCYLTHLTQGVRRLGSAALDLASVACGRYDGYWERGISPWDVAAGIVLVREAGGTVTAYDGSPLDLGSGRILASNGRLHPHLSEAIARARREIGHLIAQS